MCACVCARHVQCTVYPFWQASLPLWPKRVDRLRPSDIQTFRHSGARCPLHILIRLSGNDKHKCTGTHTRAGRNGGRKCFNIAYFLALLTCCKEHVRLCVCSPCAVHRVSFLASFIATLAKKGGPTPTVRHSDIRAPVARCTY